MGKQILPLVAGGNAKCCQPHLGKLGTIYQNGKDIHPAIPLLGTYPTDISLHIQNDICLRLLITAMLVIAKDWNQPKYASAGNLLNKLWESHTVEYYAVVKKSKEVPYVLP